MRIVAESVETIRIPIASQIAGQFVDPSVSGGRGITVALVPQGTYPSTFPITGVWETDLSQNPDAYWIAFIAPGNLVRGTNYKAYTKLAAVSGETPILEVPGVIEAV